MPPPQWEKTLKRAGNFNWWTYNSIEIKVGGIKINVIWGLYIPKTIRCIKIYFQPRRRLQLPSPLPKKRSFKYLFYFTLNLAQNENLSFGIITLKKLLGTVA